jgi:REP element-mobilizing transposase RayT
MERQLEFDFPEHGGKREGAGRKRKGEKALMPHKSREEMTRSDPLLVTARLAAGLPHLRRGEEMKIARSALKAARDRNGMRIIHYSVQGNHLHLIVEAEDRSAVARGMNGLLVRLTRGWNKLWQREGKVFPDRFHDEVITTPTQARNALRYVLQNGKKHGAVPLGSIDSCSSGLAFEGWARPSIAPRLLDTVVPASTWLLNVGWRRYGLIGIDELPKPKRNRSSKRRGVPRLAP